MNTISSFSPQRNPRLLPRLCTVSSARCVTDICSSFISQHPRGIQGSSLPEVLFLLYWIGENLFSDLRMRSPLATLALFDGILRCTFAPEVSSDRIKRETLMTNLPQNPSTSLFALVEQTAYGVCVASLHFPHRLVSTRFRKSPRILLDNVISLSKPAHAVLGTSTRQAARDGNGSSRLRKRPTERLPTNRNQRIYPCHVQARALKRPPAPF